MKKDYTDNWECEMNEEFCFWSFEDWKRELAAAGFRVLQDAAKPENGSRAYTSSWIVEHRLKGKAALFVKQGPNLRPLEFPVTHMVLVGEK